MWLTFFLVGGEKKIKPHGILPENIFKKSHLEEFEEGQLKKRKGQGSCDVQEAWC